MATYTVDKIYFNSNKYVLQDSGALQLTGGSVTGPVSFGDSVSIDEATIGDLVVNGSASFTNNLQANTINGVTVGSSPKFTDTVTTASTTGSGNAVTAVTASNGALTVTKGSTFVTSGTTSGSSTTGISISDHSTTSIYGVGSSTTSVTGVSGSVIVRGVKTGDNSTTTASKVTIGSHSTDYGVKAAGSGSFTSGAFSGGSGSFSATVTNHVLSFSHTHTAATHGADSHSHTAPTLGSKVPTVSASDVTVPIRADADTTVPVAASSATTVPIKNGSATTVVTSKTHTVNDSGHTHTV